MNGDWAVAPPVRDGGRSDRARAGSGRERLPGPALPHAYGGLRAGVHAHELDVRTLRKARMILDERPEPQELGAVGLPSDNGMRVPDRDGREGGREPVDVQAFGRRDLDGSHVHLDLPRADDDGHVLEAGAPGEPAGRDASSVPGKLGRRAVGVPDDDVGPSAVFGHDFENSVRTHAEVVVAEPTNERGFEAAIERAPLHEQIVIAQPVPFLERNRAAHGFSLTPEKRKGPLPGGPFFADLPDLWRAGRRSQTARPV